jgi:hypothetical protein
VNSYDYDARDIGSLTGFLYARPSFLEGAASVLDLGGTMAMFNESLSGEQADFLALSSDWQNIGNDIREAMRAFARELPDTPK